MASPAAVRFPNYELNYLQLLYVHLSHLNTCKLIANNLVHHARESKEDEEQTAQLVTLNELNFLVCHIIDILLIELIGLFRRILTAVGY